MSEIIDAVFVDGIFGVPKWTGVPEWILALDDGHEPNGFAVALGEMADARHGWHEWVANATLPSVSEEKRRRIADLCATTAAFAEATVHSREGSVLLQRAILATGAELFAGAGNGGLRDEQDARDLMVVKFDPFPETSIRYDWFGQDQRVPSLRRLKLRGQIWKDRLLMLTAVAKVQRRWNVVDRVVARLRMGCDVRQETYAQAATDNRPRKHPGKALTDLAYPPPPGDQD